MRNGRRVKRAKASTAKYKRQNKTGYFQKKYKVYRTRNRRGEKDRKDRRTKRRTTKDRTKVAEMILSVPTFISEFIRQPVQP